MSATPTFYILHGDDGFSRDLALQRMRAALGEEGDLNLSVFEGDDIKALAVLGAVRSMPFMAEKRLVIVKGLIRQTGRKRGRQARGRAAHCGIAESAAIRAACAGGRRGA